MDEIGSLLRTTREESGVSIEEASADLGIKELILENIEDGNIGCFKDIFVLKDHIYDYAKYLGLNPDELVKQFNEYLFEYTSRIPVKEIEKAVREQQKEATNEVKISSPYTAPHKKSHTKFFIFLYIIAAILVFFIIVWSVRQITVKNSVATEISYVK